jgi:NTE family protein
MLLVDILQVEEYALCMSSGFFRFYAHMGVLKALEENDCLRVKACSGSSAGALVTGFLASGMKPSEMPEKVFAIKRSDIWDVGFGLGLLKGQLCQEILERDLKVKTFEECSIPLGVTAYDVLGMRTNCITTGDIATAVRASCCFPGLFQPVLIDGSLHIDGGCFDEGGLMALPSVPSSNLIVNVVCGRGRIKRSVLPERFKDARLLTLVLDNIPNVSPFNMDTDGPKAYSVARAATYRMLQSGHLEQLSHNHWVSYIDGSRADLTEPLIPLPSHPSTSSQHQSGLAGSEEDDHPRMLSRRPSFQFHEKARLSGGGYCGEIRVVERDSSVDRASTVRTNLVSTDRVDLVSTEHTDRASRNVSTSDVKNQVSDNTYDNQNNTINISQELISNLSSIDIDENLDSIIQDSEIHIDMDISEILNPTSLSSNNIALHNDGEDINDIYTSLQDTMDSQIDTNIDMIDTEESSKKRILDKNEEEDIDLQEIKKIKLDKKNKKNEDKKKNSIRSQSLTNVLKRERIPSFKLRDN